MTQTEVEHALRSATARGFLVVGEPFDADSAEHARLLGEWNSHCEESGRHRVIVLCTAWGLWRTAIAFHAGPDGELAYLRHELEEAFHRHLGSGPRKDDEAWFASTQDRRRAEALAFELAAIDMEPRDPKFEDVFVVNAL
jgi:hypothetical protein